VVALTPWKLPGLRRRRERGWSCDRRFCLRSANSRVVVPTSDSPSRADIGLTCRYPSRTPFHWNASMVPLCCRKAATKGRKLLCAAAGASQPPGHPQRQPASKRLPRPGSALAGFFLAAAAAISAIDTNQSDHALPRMTKLGSGRGQTPGPGAVIDPSSFDEGHGIDIALCVAR
jgi:hypothetical protein